MFRESSHLILGAILMTCLSCNFMHATKELSQYIICVKMAFDKTI